MLTVLVVDDEDDFSEVVEILLTRRGFAVTRARSVAGAVAAAAVAPIDVLVSDMRLPDGSGHDLLRQLRGASRVPAIALSGLERDARGDRASVAEFDEYLRKPLDIDDLVDALRRVTHA